jgi:hypothetical protein
MSSPYLRGMHPARYIPGGDLAIAVYDANRQWYWVLSRYLGSYKYKIYSFWYSSLPSSFFASATFRTALLKSSCVMASLSAFKANNPLEKRQWLLNSHVPFRVSRVRHSRFGHDVPQIGAVQAVTHLHHALEIDFTLGDYALGMDLENFQPAYFVRQRNLNLAVETAGSQ